MKLRFFLSAIAMSALILISCTSKKTKSIAIQQLEIAEPFNIIYSEGGGLTGLVESYHILSTGTIEYFQKMPGRQDSLIWSKKVPANELAKLQNSLTTSNILNQPLNDTGNMTSNLTYSTLDTSYSLSWAGAGAAAEISPEMKQWLAQLKSLLQH